MEKCTFSWGNLQLCLLILLGVALPELTAFKISLFSDFNQGEVYQSTEAGSCENLPHWMDLGNFGSVRADKCIMIYNGYNCTEYSMKITSGPEIVSFAPRKIRPRSYRLCSKEEGGSQINVDLWHKSLQESKNEMLGQYRDLCGCTVVKRNVGAINNHGNCIRIYTGLTCSKDYVELPGGMSGETENWKGYVGSIAPCEVPKHCKNVSLNATITRIAINDNPSLKIREQSQVQDIVMGTTQIRNGNVTLTQEFPAKRTVLESTNIKLPTTLMNMNCVTAHLGNVEFDFNINNQFVDKTVLKLAFLEAFGHRHNQSGTETEDNMFVKSQEREFQTEQEIQVKPCEVHTVTAYVRFHEKYPIEYSLTAEITAVLNGQRVPYYNVEKYLSDDVVSVQSKGEFVVVAQVNSTGWIDFGEKIFITDRSDYDKKCPGQK